MICGVHLAIVGRIQAAAHIGLQRAPHHIALGVPEDAPLRLGLEVEQVHLLPDAAMVALGGFLQPRQVRVELLLVEPARPVDPAEHRVLLIAAPVGTGNARQLEGVGIELAG
jgi:hypothetical protein